MNENIHHIYIHTYTSINECVRVCSKSQITKCSSHMNNYMLRVLVDYPENLYICTDNNNKNWIPTSIVKLSILETCALSFPSFIFNQNGPQERMAGYSQHMYVNKGNISVLALLDYSLAFDTIDHPVLVHRLHTDFGFTDTVLKWFSSYLTDRTHYVSLSDHCSTFTHVHSGVPQGSVLGPMLFTKYIKPLSAIIDSHSIIHHSFADDLQLQMSAPPDRISELLHSMQSCISDVKAWVTANMLKLNDNKTELMLVTSKSTKHLHSLPTSITVGNALIPLKKSVKNLGFSLDCHLAMNAHVPNISRTGYFELRRLASIRRFLKSTATATLVSAFVLSRIYYCNSLLFGSTHDVTSHLQRIQNYAARVILRLPESSCITINLKSIHWLRVKVRSTYKITCLCYHCHSSTAPSYVTGTLHRKPLHTRNTRSSSYTMPLLNRPAHSMATLGDRSFSFASSSV